MHLLSIPHQTPLHLSSLTKDIETNFCASLWIYPDLPLVLLSSICNSSILQIDTKRVTSLTLNTLQQP